MYIKRVLIIVCVCIFFSCQSANQKKILGKWTGTFVEMEYWIGENNTEFSRQRGTGSAELEFSDDKCHSKLAFNESYQVDRDQVYDYTIEGDTIYNFLGKPILVIEFMTPISLKMRGVNQNLNIIYDLHRAITQN